MQSHNYYIITVKKYRRQFHKQASEKTKTQIIGQKNVKIKTTNTHRTAKTPTFKQKKYPYHILSLHKNTHKKITNSLFFFENQKQFKTNTTTCKTKKKRKFFLLLIILAPILNILNVYIAFNCCNTILIIIRNKNN